jgi:uncharacterized protein YecT (DUF1311 family)
MRSFCRFLRRIRASCVFSIVAFAVMSAGIPAANAAGLLAAGVGSAGLTEAISAQNAQPPVQEPAPIVRQPPEPQPGQAQGPQDQNAGSQTAPSNYDPALFQKPIPKDQLAFLNQFAGKSSNELYRDKRFRKLMHSFVPDCTFHYGVDTPLTDALDQVIQGSSEPVQIREARYVMVSGHMGTHHAGKGFLWIDMQAGIGLGGFYFHPGNGEPTPTVNIFSKQVVKEMLLDWSDLPPAFAEDEVEWSQAERLPPLTTRYFITGSNKKVLLEHDEDYCSPASGPGYNDCEKMNADAADIDMDAASYLEQTHYVTNATAWMITNPDQVAWLQVRNTRCGGVLDPLGCHIRMTRERTHVILHAPPPHPVAHPIHR